MRGSFLAPFSPSQLEAEKALKVKALLRKGGCGPPSNPGGQFIQKHHLSDRGSTEKKEAIGYCNQLKV